MKYGHKMIAADGQTVMIDDRGIMQTWEVSKEDNVDASNPLVLDVYIPTSAEKIVKARLRLRLKPFRAYSRGNASGGGDTVTSASGGGVSTSTLSGGGATSGNDSTNCHWILGTSVGDITMTSVGGHSHTLYEHNHVDSGGGATGYSKSGIASNGSHAHMLDKHNHPHSHSIPSHTHNFSVPSHRHDVSVPSHTHDINHGIYTSTTATGVTVKINGTDRTSALGGPFNSDQVGLNLAPYLIQGDNVIEFGSTKLGRISTSLHIQSYWVV